MKLPPGYVPGKGVHKATAYGGFGEMLMKQMGWQDGQGLGRDQKGIKKALQVKLKDDTIGVGGQAGFAWEKKWWEEAFDSEAKKIQAAMDSSDSDDSDDDVIVDVNRDGTRSSAHSHERKIAAALAKDPWGRFGGREGKMARIARQEAEMLPRVQAGQAASTSQPDGHTGAAGASQIQRAGAAGLSAKSSTPAARAQREEQGSKAGKRKQATEEPAAEQEAQPESRRRKKSTQSLAEAEGTEQPGCETRKPGKGTAKKKRKQGAGQAEQSSLLTDAACDAAAGDKDPSQRLVRVVRVPQDDSLGSTPASGWWGAARFRSAGCLEGLEHTAEHVKKQRQSFTEQTQEDLYTATHAAKTAAKKGLGTASIPRKVAGTRWQGTRTLIVEDEAEAGPQGADADDGPAEAPVCLKNAKWKKLVKAALLETPERSMTVKRLEQATVKAALAKQGITASKAVCRALQDAMLAKVSSSSMFAVEDGMVRLL